MNEERLDPGLQLYYYKKLILTYYVKDYNSIIIIYYIYLFRIQRLINPQIKK